VTPEAWSRIRTEFEALLDAGAEERERRLARLEAEDAALAAEVRSLLAADAQAGDFLDAPARPPPDSVGEGTQLGPYRIQRELGRGGMGTVFLAQRADDTFQKRVALKVVSRGLESSVVLERFTAERRILASLEHPNIARLIDAGTTPDGRPWFAMDYISGQPLTHWCRTRELSLQQRVELMRRVCLAVQFAHQRLVVHRDLKPSNILVSDDGEPHLLDFGLARVLSEDDAGQRTETQHRWLTPDYSSPEQIRGERVTTSADVHGLGLLLYEVLTGVHPLRRESPSQTMSAILDTLPAAPSSTSSLTTRGAGWSDLDAITLMALRKEPEARYASAEQLADELGRWLEGLPVRAVRGSTRYRLRRFVRRHRGAVVAAGALVLTLLGGLVTTLWQARVAERQRAIAQKRFTEMREFAGKTLFEIQDAVQEVPGATKASALLIQRSTEFLDRLAEDARDDPTLRRELASSYARLGTTLESSESTGVVGDVVAGERAFRRALELQLELAKSGDDEDLRALAATQMRLCALSFERNEVAEAETLCRASLATAKRLRGMERRFRTQLAGSYQQLAGVLLDGGKLDEALECILAEREVIGALLESAPDDAQHLRSWLSTLRMEGRVWRLRGDGERAIALATEALTRMQAVTEQHPDRSMRQTLSVTQMQLALTLYNADRIEEALVHYRAALALRHALRVEDPNDAQAMYLELSSASDVLDSLRALERFDEALRDEAQLMADGAALLAHDPRSTPNIGLVSKLHYYLGRTYQERAHPADAARALAHFRAGLKLLLDLQAAGGRPDADRVEQLREAIAELE
jgi:tRNA A-37 threonylcarbamoyl transferase component Bud32/tetratricopeptide (TPR) repeat protein